MKNTILSYYIAWTIINNCNTCDAVGYDTYTKFKRLHQDLDDILLQLKRITN